MSAPGSDYERDVDLSKWREAIVRRPWIVVGGLVAGAIVGAFYSLSGGSIYEASVLMAPSQAFSPGGAPVLSYQSSPRSINELATSPGTLAVVAALAAKNEGVHIALNKLIGHVSTSTVSTGTGSSTATRGTQLVKLTVQLPVAKQAQAAAAELGKLVVAKSTGPYVTQSIKTLQTDIASSSKRLASVERVIAAYNQVVAQGKLAPFDNLVLQTNLDNAILREGNLNDKIENLTQQLTLAENIEKAAIIGAAPTAVKTTARSRRNSILVAALIGLILGTVTAVVVQSRSARAA